MIDRDITPRRIKTAATPILKKNGVVNAGIFGSYARGKATKKAI